MSIKHSKESIEKWKKAGSLASQVKEFAKKLVKKDMPLVELAEKIESKIYELGAKPSFPVNIGINEKAAHFTPLHDDSTKISSGLVKIDLGVAIDGYATDTAFTVDLTPDKRYKEMVEATEKALKAATKLARPGTEVREIGKTVYETIIEKGFSPIRNLSGHEIDRYQIHAGLSIPNYDNGNTAKLEEGMIIAIEPFATTGVGLVTEGKVSGDFSLIEKRNVRIGYAREVLNFIEKEYSTLPFAERWIFKKFGLKGITSLRFLVKEKVIKSYQELIETSKKPVTHFENTILVKDKPEILTE